jgi:hypothetical protein
MALWNVHVLTFVQGQQTYRAQVDGMCIFYYNLEFFHGRWPYHDLWSGTHGDWNRTKNRGKRINCHEIWLGTTQHTLVYNSGCTGSQKISEPQLWHVKILNNFSDILIGYFVFNKVDNTKEKHDILTVCQHFFSWINMSIIIDLHIKPN